MNTWNSALAFSCLGGRARVSAVKPPNKKVNRRRMEERLRCFAVTHSCNNQQLRKFESGSVCGLLCLVVANVYVSDS